MNAEKIRDIMLEYQHRQDYNKEILENKIKEIHEKIPQIKLIDQNINRLGLDITRSIIMDKSEEEIKHLEEQQAAYIDEKTLTLLKNGIDPSYLEMDYSCNSCKDTGFLENGEKCNCLIQRLLNDSYKMSNLGELLKEDNFNNFSFDIYSDKIEEHMEVSPRENMKDIMFNVDNFIYNFDEYPVNQKNNLVFWGSPGIGKTFMCSCIAETILNMGYTVIYQTAFNLMDIINKYKFKTESFSDIDEENFNNLFESDLLIIDDLGTEMVNSFTVSELFNIINSRLNSKKKTIISTNLDMASIGEIYSDRILSRLVGNFRFFEFYGDDLRFR
ncbi:ATP-binding protein [Peptostreptococcus equinus]|uniref:ATP-binding protein n=1 Tax=Peptostreptococcus equinus TaxID=3003601 RepID=A0ABY7JP56_9FIRM|nr:ATP-binding protein [Peptostreptococcus sp. CBA3647]WAW14885.1 ATP-binding protein [Peptostreptococcus sp. CBA3647]